MQKKSYVKDESFKGIKNIKTIRQIEKQLDKKSFVNQSFGGEVPAAYSIPDEPEDLKERNVISSVKPV